MATGLQSAAGRPTHAVELTAAGRGAVAVVLVEGPLALAAVEECLHRKGSRLEELQLGRIVVGRWGTMGGEEVVVCRRSRDRLEVHCHGGAAAVRAVRDGLANQGCQPLSWPEWLRQSESNPIFSDAQIALTQAPTARTAAILLDQFHGALSAAVRQALAQAEQGQLRGATEILDAVLAHQDVGMHLTVPWRVVIAGNPNVGKSSLMNAIAGFQRAIVCDLPGTTRDVVTSMTAIDGWPVELADTAGLRDSCDAVEYAGIERARAAAAEADLVVLVTDLSQQPAGTPTPSNRLLTVLNKVDLIPDFDCYSGQFDVMTSAVTGAGIAELVSSIGRALVPVPPLAGEAVVFTADQSARLQTARAALQAGEVDRASAELQALVSFN